MAEQLEFAWETNPSPVPLLRLRGRLDAAGAQRLHEIALDFIKEAESSNLVIDLAGVEFVASTGLAIFLLLTEEFSEISGSIVFVNATPAVKQVISLLNIDQFLKLEPSEQDAFALVGA